MKILFSFLALLVTFNTAYAGDLQITINNIHNDKGYLLISVYNNATAFETEDENEIHTYVAMPARVGSQIITLHAFPVGTYAISVLHDENGNSQFDVDKLGTPLEGYAYSNNVGLMATPTFKQAAFTHEQTNLEMKLLYTMK
ncbi:DUF2141 domain-containing protein [Candidatus Albibeggiatoa sp. nov. NOAA]|uniref:DUF2141 domain-containing protein n=1 Tax=Candidatus Albibeggiatoa sp. nov. NOAA TaxID=3162724 RepID=UPI0032F49E5A|nr:DUF2141 domain-containing protein [Thiotrichaceae bacterium]